MSTDKTYGSLQVKRSNLVFLYSQIFVSVHIKTRTYYGHNHWLSIKYCTIVVDIDDI